MSISRWFSKGGHREKTLWTSEDQNWSVVDGEKNGVRCRFLMDGAGRLQSGVVLGGSPVPIFQYARAMVEVAVRMRCKKVLALGGGGFCVPTAIFYFATGTEIDVVDREARLEEVAEQYFFKPRHERLRFIAGEAMEFLEVAGREGVYDLVLVDVFEESGLVPEEFFDVGVFSSIKNLLADDGGILWNISLGRGDGWKDVAGRILATAKDGGVSMRAFSHEEQSSSFYRNILFSHGLPGLDLPSGWCEEGITERGDVISVTRPLVWPEKALRKGVGASWKTVS